MNPRDIARALGRLGGRARAKRLSGEHKKKIASLGGRARAHSHRAARRVAENFRYANAVAGLSRRSVKATRHKTFAGRLPGIYPAER